MHSTTGVLPPAMPCILRAEWLLLLEIPVSVLFPLCLCFRLTLLCGDGGGGKKIIKMHHHISSTLLNVGLGSKASTAAPNQMSAGWGLLYEPWLSLCCAALPPSLSFQVFATSIPSFWRSCSADSFSLVPLTLCWLPPRLGLGSSCFLLLHFCYM